MGTQRQPRIAFAVAIGGLLFTAACGEREVGVSNGPAGEPMISLSEGACEHNTCPVYDMTLRGDGGYTLNGVKFVKTTGVTEGDLTEQVFHGAEKVLQDAGFWTMKRAQTDETLSNCESGAPTVLVTWRTAEGKQKTVTYDAGCGVRKTTDMIRALRVALKFDDLVWTDKEFDFPNLPK